MTALKHLNKITVADRFAPLRSHLQTLLAELSENDWSRPTAAPGWSVKDVATHLLGGDIGVLSRERDVRPIARNVAYPQLVEVVNRLNAEWVIAARRMSPRLLCDLLAYTGPQVEAYFLSLDIDATGGPVSWAGPDLAPVWFDLAREFTERWHHQQQIRDATGRPPLYDPYFLAPVLDTFVRALPHHFRQTAASPGTAVRFEISGEAGGVWFLHRMDQGWDLVCESTRIPASDVILSQDTAWRLFTKGVDRRDARSAALIRGDADLAAPVFTATAVIG
jgi:uncharacterized protein (TIGR03083 family)